MTPLRWFYVAFWLFIVTMLVWQAIDSNATINKEVDAQPKQEHYFFFNTNTTPAPREPVAIPDGPRVVQSQFYVKYGVPTDGLITCYVVAKNIGNAKATNIQITVRPFKGVVIGNTGDGEDARSRNQPPKPADPVVYTSQSVSFSDLAPGQTSEPASVTFVLPPHYRAGDNPDPEITFEKAKP